MERRPQIVVHRSLRLNRDPSDFVPGACFERGNSANETSEPGACRASSVTMRTEFLAVYDYGTGGVWVYLLADSAAQIHERYPELRVVSDRPDWLTGEEDRRLRERMTIGIDDTQNKFRAALLKQRT